MSRSVALKFLLVTVMGLTNCAPATRFDWGNYEDALYLYYKSPDQREVYKMALTDAIDRGRRANKIAPGVLAELGYLYQQDGDAGRARELFEEEMMRFPESRPFLIRIIENSMPSPVVPIAGGPS